MNKFKPKNSKYCAWCRLKFLPDGANTRYCSLKCKRSFKDARSKTHIPTGKRNKYKITQDEIHIEIFFNRLFLGYCVIDKENRWVADLCRWQYNGKGYIQNAVFGKIHNVILGIKKGEHDFQKEVDHIDRNPMNNKKVNLRIVSRSENNYNHGVSKANKSGVTGVHWFKRDNKWEVSINVFSRKYYLGRYKNLYDAKMERKRAEVLRDLGLSQYISYKGRERLINNESYI